MRHQQRRAISLALIVAMSLAASTVIFTGTGQSANSLQNGSADPASVNETRTVTHTFSFETNNVSRDGNTDRFFVAFPDRIAGNLSPNTVSVNNRSDGSAISISSSKEIVDGPDKDGIKETITFAISPDGGGSVNVSVTVNTDVTWPDVDGDTAMPIEASVIDSKSPNIGLTQFATVTVKDLDDASTPTDSPTPTDTPTPTETATETPTPTPSTPTESDPDASFSLSPTDPAVNESVSFDATGSSDPDGSINSYEWDINGDGTTDLTGETISYTFGSTGDQSVTLTVTDGDGNTDTVTQTVSIGDVQTIDEAIAGSDNTIGLSEIQQAIQYWATGSAVPGTDGKTIGLTKLQELIGEWANNETV